MFKTAFNAAFKKLGFDSHRNDPSQSCVEAKRNPPDAPDHLGVNMHCDTHFLLAGRAGIIFDVGANFGQSISTYKNLFPESHIYSFEPDKSAFEKAVMVAAQYNDVVVNNIALADYIGESLFYEYERSDMSSRLKPAAGQLGWSELRRESKVRTTTVDAFCRERTIEVIDFLKIDTQGTDDAVLRGAEGMLRDGRIKLVRSELTFMKLYQGQFDPLESIGWMQKRGYQIVSFYDQWHKDNALAWLDILYRYRQSG
jgi:FkbM family methyltransferase